MSVYYALAAAQGLGGGLVYLFEGSWVLLSDLY